MKRVDGNTPIVTKVKLARGGQVQFSKGHQTIISPVLSVQKSETPSVHLSVSLPVCLFLPVSIFLSDLFVSQVDPGFAYAYTLLGHEFVLTEELDRALACFRNAIRVNNRHYNAWYGNHGNHHSVCVCVCVCVYSHTHI